MRVQGILFILGLVVTLLTLSFAVFAVEPFGAQVNPGIGVRAPADTAGNHSALAGNVTELTLFGYTTTEQWQGYFGNVSGTIQLADSGDHVMYNWSLAHPEGEVYSSINSSILWIYTQCLNFTATGTFGSDIGQAGGTSLYGKNLTQLEDEFGIKYDDVDSVNNTFYLLGGAAHDTFYTNNLQFNADECQSTRVYGDTGAGVSGEFQEVLLYEPQTASVVFTSILDEENPLGFDGNAHDFEMLVLENGHGNDTATTTYYFYVEIE
jgi:hypothetical protein